VYIVLYQQGQLKEEWKCEFVNHSSSGSCEKFNVTFVEEPSLLGSRLLQTISLTSLCTGLSNSDKVSAAHYKQSAPRITVLPQ
jgi:hypothetical protein